MGDEGDFQWDWENESIPLEPCGKGPPKFIGPSDKHSANEGDNAFLSFQVEGDPAPTVKWFKGFKDLSVEPRYKFFTDGSRNLAILGVNQCRSEEEGDYRAVLTNHQTGEEAEFEFKFFVTVEGGMDFRAMLMKRKKPQKKVVVKKPEWLESPVEQDVQQGKCDKVVFTAKLSEKEKRGKWYLMNSGAFNDVRAQEYGIELYKDNKDKYEIASKDDWYSLTILNPCVADAGKYTLVVRMEKDQMKTGAYLNVAAKDPEYYFKKKMKTSQVGYATRIVEFRCQLNEEGARVEWTKGNQVIKKGDMEGRVTVSTQGTKITLLIDNAVLDDLGIYSCNIMEFVKNGEEDSSDCELKMEEYPHKFTSKLKGQKCVEHDRCEFDINVEADDAEVWWYHNGQRIVPDDKRVQLVVEGKKRRLVIKDTLMTDTGEISVRTNKDNSSADLKVAYDNRFVQELPGSQVAAVEREGVSVSVQVKDPDAPVTFYLAGKKVTAGRDGREVTKKPNGVHTLHINRCMMSDLGTLEAKTPSNRGQEVVTSCSFEVEKGEEAPELGDCGPVTGIANKDCNWKMSCQVEGKQQSPMEVIVMKDGKELKLGKHVNVQLAGDSVSLSVINPKREKSGVYTVIVRNAQGQSERDIMVNIMDKPTPPETCTVSDVYYDNCIVHWTPPLDDGGTEIKKYIVEALDVSSGMQQWSEVAVTGSGGDRKIKVENLTHRHKYRFRVKAANKLGRSDPTEMLGDDILIKDPWDEPTAPGKPTIEDWGPDRCDLSWEPPESDGGAVITHYEIEYMELHGDVGIWEKGISITTKDLRSSDGLLHGKCPGLQEGQEYVFRVKAVNKGGPSLPSPQSDSMIAKTRYIKPFLHQPGMYDIELKKGRTFRYDIWFGGEPPPTVIWERNGMKVEPDQRTSVELFSKKTVYCQRNSVLTVVKSERVADGGHYKIRLVCDAGTYEATGYVNVLDVPEKPRNLAMDEVRAEHVKLSWAPPDDDGGTPITGYVVRVLDLEGGDWLQVAETTGLNTAIKGLRPGHLYQLEVCAINKEGIGNPIRTKDPIKAENPYEPPSPPKEPYITDFDNQSVTLRWSKPHSDGGRPITHYIVQKKDKFGGWFDALVTDDSNCCAIIDELEARIPGLSEGKWYQFRVVAVNKAGESWPSWETKPHLCRHKNLRPTIDQGAAGSKSVKVNRSAIWHIKCKGEPPPKFSWYKDGRLLQNCEEIKIETKEYQGGSTATMQIVKSGMSDAGCYTLVALNRNGKAMVDLDLVVLDLMHDPECDMFKSASLTCACSSSFRESELTTEQLMEVLFT